MQNTNPKKLGGFFTVNLSQIDNMVKQGAGADDVMAYLVLARGRGKNDLAWYGANAVANRTGLTYYKAAQSKEWLIGGGYTHEGVDGKKRWQITKQMDVHDLALANALVDGIGSGEDNPPLARIYNEVSMGVHCVLPDARLDALMVLLHLYNHHSMADYGGVNPRAGIFRGWKATENSDGDQVVDVEGTNAALYEIEGSFSSVFLRFAEEALCYVTDKDEKSVRFWDAFHNLEKLGFMYEVTQVWSGNPEKDKKEEPLYTLYIHDSYARKSERYLSKLIHSAAIKHGAMLGSSLGKELGMDTVIGTGRFRYIAHKKSGGFPIGIYRLRFRAGTKDTGKGMMAEESRFNNWADILAKL